MLTKLRIELGEELKRIKSERSGRPVAPSGPCIFLAEVTDDQDDRRDELDTYAKQAGLTVLPEAWLPSGGCRRIPATNGSRPAPQ